MDCKSVESSEKGMHSGTGESPEKMQKVRCANPGAWNLQRRCRMVGCANPGARNLQRRCRMVGYAFQEHGISRESCRMVGVHSRVWNLWRRCRICVLHLHVHILDIGG
jgi:hypothetical protein